MFRLIHIDFTTLFPLPILKYDSIQHILNKKVEERSCITMLKALDENYPNKFKHFTHPVN